MKNNYMNIEKVYHFCDKAAMILLCILMGDCCVFGAGRLLSFGSISFRIIILSLLLLVSLPLMILNIKELLKNRFLWLVVGFAAWLIISTIVGILNGNRTSLILIDLKGFAYFILLPAAFCILTTRERIHVLMKCMMYCSAFSALAILISLCSYLWFPELYNTIKDFTFSLQIASFSSISTKIPRMFFKSVLYLLCGCAFSVYFQTISSSKKLSFKYVFICAICLFALLMTYTRSVYLAALLAAVGISVFIFVFNEREGRKKLFKQLGTAAAAFLIIVGAFSLLAQTNYIGYAISRSTVGEIENNNPGSSENPSDNLEEQMKNDYLELTVKSDQLRQKTLKELYDNIKKSPIIGNGLGAEIEIRPDGLNEYFYLDLLSKTGVIGLVLYLSPALLGLWMFIRFFKKKNDCRITYGVWGSVLAGFFAFSWFNPYMNASLGVLFYCCALGVFHFCINQLRCAKEKNDMVEAGAKSEVIA